MALVRAAELAKTLAGRSDVDPIAEKKRRTRMKTKYEDE